MRILIFLKPTNIQGTKTEYTNFRNFLEKDGYKMYIPEVYMRICTNRKGAEKHFRRLEEFIPKTGAITVLRLTEKQFENMVALVGEIDKTEKITGKNAHIMV